MFNGIKKRNLCVASWLWCFKSSRDTYRLGDNLDLVKKIAVLDDDEEVQDPYDWYMKKYDTEPDYSELMKSLAKTQAERNEILKPYFEPDEDSDEDDKKPSKAHVAIAKMIKDGYIRVVITTNFDKLLEQALTDEGITPTVISNTDQLKGATPLVHSSCTIIKVHGDYMDNRIKNTDDELSNYDDEMKEFLDRIFDEFGLIICGWSADWDIALRDSIYRCKNNRYSAYWLKKGNVSERAKQLISFKKAEVIDIQSAEAFFPELLEKLNSLNDLTMREAPLTVDLASATLKRLLPEKKNIIRIHDIILDETKRVFARIEELDWSIKPDNDIIKQRVEQIEAICEILLNLFAIGIYWGDMTYHTIWQKSFLLLLNMNVTENENRPYTIWTNLNNYPALLLLYIIMIMSIESEDYQLLYKIMHDTKIKKEYSSDLIPAFIRLDPENVIDKSTCNDALFTKAKKVPISERVYDVIRKPIENIISNEIRYDIIFDKAEYFYSLNQWYYYAKNRDGSDIGSSYARYGKFGYKTWDYDSFVKRTWDKEISQDDEWFALKAKFFNGKNFTFTQCYQNFNRWLLQRPGLH